MMRVQSLGHYHVQYLIIWNISLGGDSEKDIINESYPIVIGEKMKNFSTADNRYKPKRI